MKTIIEQIEQQFRLFHAAGCSVEQVMEAEEQLGLRFADEYRNYIMKYGAISFDSHEFTGLNVDSYINVTDVTLQERELRDKLPADCYVVQQVGIEGLVILQHQSGAVYQLDEAGNCSRIADSFNGYLAALL